MCLFEVPKSFSFYPVTSRYSVFTNAQSKEVHYLTSTEDVLLISKRPFIRVEIMDALSRKVFKDNQEIVDDQTPCVRLLDLLI